LGAKHSENIAGVPARTAFGAVAVVVKFRHDYTSLLTRAWMRNSAA
jgi:hypothetical protein